MEGQDKEMFEKLSLRTHVLERDFADFKKNQQDMRGANSDLVDRILNMQGVIEELRGQLAEGDRLLSAFADEIKSSIKELSCHDDAQSEVLESIDAVIRRMRMAADVPV